MSSWTSGRLVAAGSVVAGSALAIGLALSHLFVTSSVGAAGVSPSVAGAVETAPETEILDAVAVTRDGPHELAPTEQLTVVQVSVSVCGARSTGSGFLVADGLILTAAHVVGDADLVRIDHRGATVTGEVLGVLADGRDVALIAVDAPMTTALATARVPQSGFLTLAGHPAGGPRSAHVGPVVEIAPVVATLAGPGDIIGVDVTIAEGISGGPAVDADGNVVGVVVAKEAATDTALVLSLPDLGVIGSAGLVPGECPGTA